MGEIAEAMLSGEMCEMCGTPLCNECADMGIPMYCSLGCAEDRGVGKDRVCTHEEVALEVDSAVEEEVMERGL